MSDQLRSIYARWQCLEADKTAISEDLKELFAEAKSNGYDTKALRAAFRQANLDSAGAAALDEHAILVAVYLAGIVGTNDASRAHPRIAREPSLGTADQRLLTGERGRVETSTPAPEAKAAPAPCSDDDDMAIPAFMRRTA